MQFCRHCTLNVRGSVRLDLAILPLKAADVSNVKPRAHVAGTCSPNEKYSLNVGVGERRMLGREGSKEEGQREVAQ